MAPWSVVSLEWSWVYGSTWVLFCQMRFGVDSRLRGNDVGGCGSDVGEGVGVTWEGVGMTERLLVQVELDLPTSPRVVKPVLSSTDVQDVVLG